MAALGPMGSHLSEIQALTLTISSGPRIPNCILFTSLSGAFESPVYAILKQLASYTSCVTDTDLRHSDNVKLLLLLKQTRNGLETLLSVFFNETSSNFS